MFNKSKNIIVSIVVVSLGIVLIFLFNFKKGESAMIEHPFVTRTFNQIKIDDQDDNITFKTGDKYRVVYNGRKDLKPQVTVNKGILKVKSQHKTVVINGTLFNLFGPTHSLLGQNITIEMPKKELEKLDLETQNGNISADNLNVKRGKIESSNGKIDINNLITAKGFYINLDNGSVAINHNNASGYDLSLDNGRVKFANKNKGEDYEYNSNSRNTLTVEMVNGKIDVN